MNAGVRIGLKPDSMEAHVAVFHPRTMKEWGWKRTVEAHWKADGAEWGTEFAKCIRGAL